MTWRAMPSMPYVSEAVFCQTGAKGLNVQALGEAVVAAGGSQAGAYTRPLCGSTNVSTFCGTGGAFRDYSGGMQEGHRGIRRCVWCILCQKWLRLS